MPMRASLNRERLMDLLHYDPLSGAFTWRSYRGGGSPRQGDVAGYREPCGYWCIQIDGRAHKAHRLAWLYVHGSWPGHTIDHINGDKVDNRIANLRDVPLAINVQNQRRASRNNKVGRLGVYTTRSKRRYQAAITVNRQIHHLGSFPTAEEAQQAYVAAKRRLHPGGTL